MLKKIVLTMLVLLIGISALSGIFEERILSAAALSRIDDHAREYYDSTFKNALYTYGIVRGINAVISVIQGSDIALSPAGMGITLAVGEILDPLNDLIERFSWICLAATTSLGIQRLLMSVTAWLGITFFLPLSMLITGIGIWLPQLKNVTFKQLGLQLLILALVFRYALPLTAFATGRIDTLFFQQTYREAAADLERANAAVQDDAENLSSEGERSLLEKFQAFFRNVDRAVQLEARVRSLKASVAGYTGQIIDLIVVFVLQTLVVPLIVLYLLLRLGGWMLKLDLVSLLRFRVPARGTGGAPKRNPHKL